MRSRPSCSRRSQHGAQEGAARSRLHRPQAHDVDGDRRADPLPVVVDLQHRRTSTSSASRRSIDAATAQAPDRCPNTQVGWLQGILFGSATTRPTLSRTGLLRDRWCSVCRPDAADLVRQLLRRIEHRGDLRGASVRRRFQRGFPGLRDAHRDDRAGVDSAVAARARRRVQPSILCKEVFGGTGMNIFNVALMARAFLFFAYPAQMSR